MQLKASFIFSLLFSMLFFSCKNEANYTKDATIQYIKKEVVYTTDGKAINLGGDSIAKVYYMIRHAEKDTQKLNPPLNALGTKRAAKLTSIMRQTFLDGVYTTYFNRTFQTIDSITQYKGLSGLIYTNDNMKQTFTDVKKSPTLNKLLIVGHTNTVTPLANFLLGKQYFNKILDEKEYDKFIIIVQKRDSTNHLYEFRY
jgi:2,3-bisphosphoglycerate-dependent phosphoglycerate mutase